MRTQKPREIAARALLRAQQTSEYVEDVLAGALPRSGLEPSDRGLIHEIVYGVTRWRATLDWLIRQKTPGRMQKPMIEILLRLGLYQIFWLDRIPNHAAVHESVELAKQLGFGPQAGFINALLRGYLREEEQTVRALEELKQTDPATGYSHPEWLVKRWQARWGETSTARLLEWNNAPAPTFARVNTLKAQPNQLIERWREETVEFDFFPRDWIGENVMFQLKAHPPLETMRSFQDGWFYVQDPSTLLAVRELNAQPGESILDLCSAPGGKTTFLAQCMENRGFILAQDLHPRRLQMVRENCARLGVTCVETARAAESILPELTRQFDRVLIDAPCSNTGVMRRRIDLRWRIRPEEIQRLASVQLDLLHRGALQLRPGGTLVYSTCSLEPEENEAVIEAFLAAHPDFRLEQTRLLLPFQDGVDGAYVARLQRIEPAA